MAPKTTMTLLCLLLALGPAATPVCTAADGLDQNFTLTFTPSDVNGGDPVQIDIAGGTPNGHALVYIIMVNGFPFVQYVMRVKLDANGSWSGVGATPTPPAPIAVTCMVAMYDANRDVIISNFETINISP